MNIKAVMEMPRLHNHFRLEVVDAENKAIVQEAFAENIVVDFAIRKLFSEKYATGYYIDKLVYGDGTGELDPARTGLFAQKGSVSLSKSQTTTPDLVTFTGTSTLSESAYIGGYITEVGLASSAGVLHTHAMLTDSEGNPITLGPKTAAQIWNIYSTWYVERSASMEPFDTTLSDYYKWWYAYYFPTTGTPVFHYPLMPQMTGQTLNVADGSYGSLENGVYSAETKTTSLAVSVPAANHNKERMDSSNGGPFPTTDILGVHIYPCKNPLWFPNHDVFPTFTFSERTIGTGDGSTKYFGFPNGYFIDGTEVIKVGGVTQVAGVDYTTSQGYRQTVNRKSTDKIKMPYGTPIVPDVYVSNASKQLVSLQQSDVGSADALNFYIATGVIVDLKELFAVSGFAFGTSSSTTINGVKYATSVDGVNWTAESAPSSAYRTILLSLLATSEYRYLWLVTGSYFTTITRLHVFGPPQIKFATPPALNATVTATWQTDIPPKNANFSYATTLAVTGSW